MTILRIAMTSLLEISLEISSNQPWLDDEMYAVGVESGRVLFDADGACVETRGHMIACRSASIFAGFLQQIYKILEPYPTLQTRLIRFAY